LLASLSLLISFFFFAPREALVVLKAVGAGADPVAKIKSLQSQQLLLLRSRLYFPNTHGQQESTASAWDDTRQELHQTTQPATAFLSPRRPGCLTAIP
jgi:hypothetical protein